MKVELQAGDTIAIPDGCKATIKDGSVVFEKEFEDGDVLRPVHDDLILIYKESCSSECFSSHFNTMHNYNNDWNTRSFRHATEEEKQKLFDKMKEQGLKWNDEKKRVEKIRWRAEEGGGYYSIDTDIEVWKYFEDNDTCDNKLYNALNYFHTKEQAEEVAKRIKEVLRKYHEEIGE